MHGSEDIDYETRERKEPVIITFYNNTKGGVDSVGKIKAAYSVARCSIRLLLTAFFMLMNVSIINA